MRIVNALYVLALTDPLHIDLTEGRLQISSLENPNPNAIQRKRNVPDKSVAPLRATNVFGNVVDKEEELFDEVIWSRLLADSSSYYPQTQCKFDLTLDCYLAHNRHVSCKDYMRKLAHDPSLDCKRLAVYEYSIANIGRASDSLNDIKIALNGDRPFISIIDELPEDDRSLLPGRTLTSSLTESLDFCAMYKGVSFEIAVECAGDSFMATSNYDFDPIPPPTCDAKIELSCEASDGGPCVPRSKKKECTFRPHYFDFLLSGGLCAGSKNSQDSHKFECSDHGDVTDYSEFFVLIEGAKSGDVYFTGFVNRDETFVVGLGYRVDADMTVYILTQDGKILQQFYFDSSCSKNLALDDTFGAITVAGFRDDHDNITKSSVAEGPQYNVSYKIKNKGQNDIILKNLTLSCDDNEDTVIVPSYRTSIHPGGIFTDYTTEINITTNDFEAIANLRYETMPSFNSRVCLTTAKYNAPNCDGEYSRNKSSKKKSRASACDGKVSKRNGKGKGSYKSSKSGKGKGHNSSGKGKSSKHASTKTPPHPRSKSKGKGHNNSSSKGKSSNHVSTKTPTHPRNISKGKGKGKGKGYNNPSGKGKSSNHASEKSVNGKSSNHPRTRGGGKGKSSKHSKNSNPSKGKSGGKGQSSKSAKKAPKSSKHV